MVFPPQAVRNTRWMTVAALLAVTPCRAVAQRDSVMEADRPARSGAQFRLPLASLLLPGLAQYVYGQHGVGAAFTGAAALGVGLYASGDRDAIQLDQELPRRGDGQRAFYGIQLVGTAGALSAYEAFRTALPALQGGGQYGFLERHEATGSLFTAPFDLRFLSRWTTWVELAYTGAITALVAIEGTDPGKTYPPFRAGDGAFAVGVSLNAGVGEEALFRGWLYPLLYQNLSPRWLANPLQAAIFGALHPQAGPFAAVIGGWAFYEGWLTTRNDWSVRESIFHHFWYDVAVITATLLTDDAPGTVSLTFPSLRF